MATTSRAGRRSECDSPYRLPEVAGGIRIEQIALGTAVKHGLLLAQLSAPHLGYFETALPAFEESVQTIVLKPHRNLR